MFNGKRSETQIAFFNNTGENIFKFRKKEKKAFIYIEDGIRMEIAQDATDIVKLENFVTNYTNIKQPVSIFREAKGRVVYDYGNEPRLIPSRNTEIKSSIAFITLDLANLRIVNNECDGARILSYNIIEGKLVAIVSFKDFSSSLTLGFSRMKNKKKEYVKYVFRFSKNRLSFYTPQVKKDEVFTPNYIRVFRSGKPTRYIVTTQENKKLLLSILRKSKVRHEIVVIENPSQLWRISTHDITFFNIDKTKNNDIVEAMKKNFETVFIMDTDRVCCIKS